jgi:dTDP-4-dehydrorhamnose reductase
MPTTVLVLGGTGMLGSMLADYLSRQPGLEVTATARTHAAVIEMIQAGSEVNATHSPKTGSVLKGVLPEDMDLHDWCIKSKSDGLTWRSFDAGRVEYGDELSNIADCEWVINAIGITKPLIHDDNAAEVQRAILVNSLFPHRLAARAQEIGARVLQIATDCVYSGSKGRYVEADSHDAVDVYGKTKSLGEVHSPNVHHLRCSIIGPEPKEKKFLLEWFLGQPKTASLSGYANHRWNGVTTLHFAKLCCGILRHSLPLPHLQHVVPSGEVTKHELLQCFARHYQREDLAIKPTQAGVVVDRTLATANGELNRALWAAAGYAVPPTVPEMVAELGRYDFRFLRS